MIKYYIFAVLAVIVTAFAQVLLKIGANRSAGKSKLDLFLNIYTISGLALFVLVTLLSLFALMKVEVKEMSFIGSLSFLFVPLLSYLILKEEVNKNQVIGAFVILLGIFVFNLSKLL